MGLEVPIAHPGPMDSMSEHERQENERIWAGTYAVEGPEESAPAGVATQPHPATNRMVAGLVTAVVQVLWLPIVGIAWVAGWLAAFTMTGGEFGFWGEPGEDPGVLFWPLVASLTVVCAVALPAPYLLYRKCGAR